MIVEFIHTIKKFLLGDGAKDSASSEKNNVHLSNPLYREIQKSRRRAQTGSSDAARSLKALSGVPDVRKPLEKKFESVRFLSRAYGTLELIYTRYLRVLFRPLSPFLSLLALGYRSFYNRFAFVEDKEGKRNVYVASRSAASVVTLFFFSLFLLYHLVYSFIPLSGQFIYDAVAINLFSYEDKLVFSRPDWVSGETGVLSVFACRKYPCSGQDDSVEFRIRDSFYLDVKRTFTKFEPHDPGELAGAFLSEENLCTFRAYGTRVKYLNFYPYIFEAVCTPMANIKKKDFDAATDNLPVSKYPRK